ncbi:citrate lyase holo-[acyl-carrier protein] synthase [Vibrio sp. JC009]|uniref:citrate lyase holo-[acyl-carrier protein] synthase n=1 Tax=Vibrio sp. JC009 TaxID=2912314 RepID=UPI0023B13626|nr:citrate lyase holo-[acyl-carrier protein] synthase [Vibrio sp. JC009]WED23949.1 citrate lyase holo-[acyl-carrier protein] synthase [Vibrio sp. JC009]
MQDFVTLYDKHESAQVRAQRQQRLVSQYSLPLITLNNYVPQHMVHTTAAKKLFQISLNAVQEELNKLQCRVVKSVELNQKTGDELLLVVVGASSSELKRAMIKLEKHHMLGALMNVDVMTDEGKMISRQACEMEPRKCVICDNAASYCTTIRNHSAEQLGTKLQLMLETYQDEMKAAVTEVELEEAVA